MICSIDMDLLREYPVPLYAWFGSSTETADPQTDAHITNAYDGYNIEAQKCGQANAAVGTHNLVAAPYSTRLRPLSKLDELYSAQKVLLVSVEFFGSDVTLDGSAHQDAPTIAAIYASRSTNDAYAQSLFREAQVMNWLRNFFRPEFFIDNKNVLKGIASSNYGNQNNKGDLSIGLPVPHCFFLAVELGIVKSVDVFAQLAQQVGAKFQRYFVTCLATFRCGFDNRSV